MSTERVKQLVNELESRIAHLKAAQKALLGLDTTEFSEDAQALQTLLKDPAKVEEAERRLEGLKAAVLDRQERRRRLSVVEQALQGLDTTEFSEDAQALRALLKDPTKVQEAEQRLEDLRAAVLDRQERRRRLAVARNKLDKLYGAAIPEKTRAIMDLLGNPNMVDQVERLLSELEKKIGGRQRRTGRLNEIKEALSRLDTAEFREEAQALSSLLDDPANLDQAERQWADLERLVAAERLPRRARAALRESISWADEADKALRQGLQGEAQGSLQKALAVLVDAHEATVAGKGTQDLLLEIAAAQRALIAKLLLARLEEARARAAEGTQELKKNAFDGALETFRGARDFADQLAREADEGGFEAEKVEAEALLKEVDGNIEACLVAKDRARVEELLLGANELLEESRNAKKRRELRSARDALDRAISSAEEGVELAAQRSIDDLLPRANELLAQAQEEKRRVFEPPSPERRPQRSPPLRLLDQEAQQQVPWTELYTVTRLLGGGGYADVYLAQDKDNRRHVALKVPRGFMPGTNSFESLSDPRYVAFVREIEIWKTLQHDHIVQLYESGGLPYPWLAMEFMSGGTLRSRLQDLKAAPVLQVLDLLLGICSAVEYAHDLGIVHRDIKPENILFNERGAAKLSDWGLAKHALFQSLSKGSGGAPAYSAPEQLRPGQYGGYWKRGDVFQIGIVLFEVLTGRHPFALPGEDLFSLSELTISERIVDVAFEAPRPSTLRPELMPALDEVVDRCLRRPVQARYRDGLEVREALETLRLGL